MKAKLQNFWYYYKVPVIIVLVILAVGLWFFLQDRMIESADYDIAVVSPRGCSDEQAAVIRRTLEAAGRDQDRDGFVRADLHIYRFAIGKDGQDQTEVAKLDADLVGNVSGLFFTDDPESFERAVNGIVKAADAVPVSDIPLLAGSGLDDLYLVVRSGADEKYTELKSAITQ